MNPPSRPLISILTVTHNAESLIGDCIRSVAQQEGVAFEHWIVDGASTDGTVAAIQSLAHPCLRWVSEPDEGIYAAMNKGIDPCAGQWVLFLGADDRLRSDSLRQIAAFLERPDTIYYGDVWLTGRGQRYAGRFSMLQLAIRNICQQSIFYPRAVFDTFRFDPRYRIQADWVLNMACWQHPAFRFQHVPMIVADYNDTTGISSRSRDLAIEKDYVRLLNRFFPCWIAWPLSLATWLWRGLTRKRLP